MELLGRRVKLRDWVSKDLSKFSYWMNSGHKWQDLDGPYYPKLSAEDVQNRVKDLSKKIDEKNFEEPRSRLVIADLEDDQIIGTVIAYWESKETNWLCIGITIYDEKNWSKGYGTDALTLWIQYLFDTYKNIVRLDMRTWSGNQGLIRLASKLGFTQEACFRKARIVDNKYYDGLGFGILKDEWLNFFR